MFQGVPDDIVETSHSVQTRISSWRGGKLLAAGIPLVSGSYGADIGTNVSSSIKFETSLEWEPDAIDAPLAPYGQRLQVDQVLSGGGETYVVPLGWFLITKVSVNVLGNLSVEAADLMQLVVDNRFLSPRQPAANATFFSETLGLVDGSFPVKNNVADRALSGVNTTDWVEDRAKALGDIESAWPARFQLDRYGVMQIDPPPVAGTVVRTWAHGEASAYVSRDEAYAREDIYNAVVVRGRTADNVDISAVAYSPLPAVGWGSAFGRRPMFVFSPLVDTQARANAEASSRSIGLSRRFREIVVTAPPDPRIDLGDTVAVADSEGRTHKGIVTSIDLPFGPGAAQYRIGGAAWTLG